MNAENAVSLEEAQNRAAPELRAVATFLRGKNGPKVRRGVLNGSRSDYFKGKSAIKALMSPAYKKVKNAPKVETEEEATAVLLKVLPHAFFLRVERPAQNPPTPSGQPKPLAIAPQQNFDPAAYYVWFIASSPLSTYIGSAAMVAVILAGVMFPLWPPIMRQGVSYLSMGVLGLIGLFIGVAVVRLILWMLTSLVLRRGIWWFPNLFEDVGFVDSFIPFWGWDEPAQTASGSKSKYKSNKDKRSSKTKVPASAAEIGTAAQALAAEASAALTGASTPASGEEVEDSATKGLGDAPSTAAKTQLQAAAMEAGGDANMRKRQMAYVEDADE